MFTPDTCTVPAMFCNGHTSSVPCTGNLENQNVYRNCTADDYSFVGDDLQNNPSIFLDKKGINSGRMSHTQN